MGPQRVPPRGGTWPALDKSFLELAAGAGFCNELEGESSYSMEDRARYGASATSSPKPPSHAEPEVF